MDNGATTRAVITIFLLRSLVLPDLTSPKIRFRVLPEMQLLTELEAAKTLLGLAKPVSCGAIAQGEVVEIACVPINSQKQAEWQDMRRYWVEGFNMRLNKLPPPDRVSPTITLICGQWTSSLELDDFLTWRREYDVPDAGSVVEEQKSTGKRKLVMRFLRESESPVIRGSIRRVGPTI